MINLLRLIVGALAACALALASTHGFAVERVWFERTAAGTAARADLHAGQHDLLDKLVRGGYEARFHLDVNFYQRREWLPDPAVGDISWHGVLSYDSLTQRYVLASGGARRFFSTLAEAMGNITRLRARPNADADYLKILNRNDIYLRARFYLSTAHLPEPVQIGLLVDPTAQLDSDWQTMVLEVIEGQGAQ